MPSFCAAAARLGRSLTSGSEPLHIIPGGVAWADMLDLPGSKVLMKPGRKLPAVLDQLERRGLLEDSGMVQNCGLSGEQVFESLTGKPLAEGYFTTLIVP